MFARKIRVLYEENGHEVDGQLRHAELHQCEGL